MRIIRWLGVISLALVQITNKTTISATDQAIPDIRFILQMQAGLSAYTKIADGISLSLVRPMFTSIELENSSYILGEYTLSNRTEKVKLAIGSEGWAITWHPREYASEDLFDCPIFDTEIPGQMIIRLERALLEIANALSITEPTISYYDFRNPQASGIILHWLFIPKSGSQTSTIELPLLNNYLERGYFFCTTLTSSKLWLNSQIIDQQGSLISPIFRYGPLAADQLRAGQTNGMKIEALSVFGNGFVGGVTTVYSGTAPINTSGGYRRELVLEYPIVLGQALTIHQSFWPIVQK
jgi:hypothetical protein